jgi:hypothetical protein
MQVGTEILLARMKEYPDEFFHGNYESRWMSIIDDSRKYLPKEDVEALDEGYRQMQIDKFNERVLARLAGEDKQPEETMKIKASGRYAPTQFEYEQAMKQAQYDADQRRQAMNNAMQNSLYTGANGIGTGDWLFGSPK